MKVSLFAVGIVEACDFASVELVSLLPELIVGPFFGESLVDVFLAAIGDVSFTPVLEALRDLFQCLDWVVTDSEIFFKFLCNRLA